MRLTIDLDYPTVFKITKTWLNVERVCTDVKGRLSSSKEGVHIEGWGIETDDPRAIKLRRIYGDDPIRIELDISRYWRVSQVLYDEKDGKQAGNWTDNVDHLVAEYERKNPDVVA